MWLNKRDNTPPGRHNMAMARTERVVFRARPSEREMLARAAKSSGQSVSELVRNAAKAAALEARSEDEPPNRRDAE